MSLTKCTRGGWLISRVMWILERSQLNVSNPEWKGSQRASWLGTIVNSLWTHKVPARAFISIYLDYLLPDWLHVTKSAKSLSPRYLAPALRHPLLRPKANSRGTGGGTQPAHVGHHEGQGAALLARKLGVLDRRWVMARRGPCHRPQAGFAFCVCLSCNLQSLSCNYKPNVSVTI